MQTKQKRVGWVTLRDLQAWRAKYVFSQEELARRAQVSRATISAAEHGRRITFKAADSIAKVFEVDRATLAHQVPAQEEKPDGVLVPT